MSSGGGAGSSEHGKREENDQEGSLNREKGITLAV